MNKEFQDFQNHFTHCQKLFGLTGYQVYFKHEPVDGGYAAINFNCVQMVATVYLNNKIEPEDRKFFNVKRSAKHEALHLLIAHLEYLAHCRSVRDEEITSASEAIVVKLEELIPD